MYYYWTTKTGTVAKLSHPHCVKVKADKDETVYTILVALAGYKKEDITLEHLDSQLTLKVAKRDFFGEDEVVTNTLSGKGLDHTWHIGNMTVISHTFIDGMLKVELLHAHPQPEPKIFKF